MRGLLVVLTLLSVVLCQLPRDEKIILATKDQFQKMIGKNKYVFAYFSRENCTYCDAFYPELKKASDMISVGSPGSEGMPVVKIDMTNESEESAKYLGIQGYPSVRLYANGSYCLYNGIVEGKAIESWVDERVQMYIHETKDDVFLWQFSMGYDVSAMFFYEKPENANDTVPFLSEYKQVAKLLKRYDYGFSYTSLPNARERMNFTKTDPVRLVAYTGRGEDRYVYDGPLELESFYSFMKDVIRPFYSELNDNALQHAFGGELKKSILFLFSSSSFSEGRNMSQRQLAKENRDMQNSFNYQHNNSLHTIICIQNETNPYYARLISFLGVQNVVPPLAVIYEQSSKKKFRQQLELEPSNVKLFVDSYRRGQLQPYFKSDQPLSQEQNWKKDMLIVVGSNFKKVVIDGDYSVVVFFFTKWCKFCTEFDAAYDEAFKRFKEKLGFAKIDGSDNDIEGVEIKHFPTVRLFKKGEKSKVIEYDGDLSAGTFIDFLNKHLGMKISREDL